jgi:hypothetical protein
MARSQAQSDFSVSRPAKLPAVAAVVELPRAEEWAEASALATRWMLRLTVVALAVLAVLCLVGPHIPGGE